MINQLMEIPCVNRGTLPYLSYLILDYLNNPAFCNCLACQPSHAMFKSLRCEANDLSKNMEKKCFYSCLLDEVIITIVTT